MITSFGYRGGITVLHKGSITSCYLLNPDSRVSWEAPELRQLACTTMLDIKGGSQGKYPKDKN